MSTLCKVCSFLRADFFSPKDFVRHAGLIVSLFAIAHLFGLREFTAIISGTMASPELGANVCALLGMGYLALYFGVVVLVPVLLIAAGLLKGWQVVRQRRAESPRADGQ
jgi:hypothetical protein